MHFPFFLSIFRQNIQRGQYSLQIFVTGFFVVFLPSPHFIHLPEAPSIDKFCRETQTYLLQFRKEEGLLEELQIEVLLPIRNKELRLIQRNRLAVGLD